MDQLHNTRVRGKDSNSPVIALTVETGSQLKTVRGRDAWALSELISSGSDGVTPIDRPAPRWSHYIFKLRRSGLNVETIDEAHGGAFSGYHARYVLQTPLRIREIGYQHDKPTGRAAA